MSPSKPATSGAGSVLRSMTGFGAASSEEEDGRWTVEVRSVNHRHLLVKCRLGGELAALEADVEALVKERLSRGSVSVYLNVRRGGAAASAAFDADLAETYRSAIAALGERLEMDAGVTMETLLGLPGVVSMREGEGDDPAQRKALVLGVVERALGELVEMREAEGRAIAEDLAKHARELADLLARIEARMPEVVHGQQAALKKRVAELLENHTGLEERDLAREIALLADRLDVSEETARLASHLDQLQEFLRAGGTIGRKLDFLVQEFFREINTIGSKCSDAQIAHWVVEAKTHVERLREQVQNVE